MLFPRPENSHPWIGLQLNAEEVFVFFGSSSYDFLQFFTQQRLLEEECAEVDNEEERQDSEHNVQVSVACYQNHVANEFNRKYNECLHKTDQSSKDGSFKLPRMVQSIVHVAVTLLELSLQVDVEDESSSKAEHNNWSAYWLQLE